MSKPGSTRSNPFVTGCETIEKDLEHWNKSIKAEDCPLPDSDWSTAGGHFRSRQIGFEPAPQNEDTANLALDASTRAAWVQCALLVREYDKGIIGKWHRNLDTRLVFAALFSAVITALLVESSGIPNVDENPRSRIIIVNSFWVCSLILSLNSVMLTIFVKQWLAEYTWDVGTAVLSPEQTFTLRQMRFAVLQKWRVPTIIDYLPLQLLAALVLFYGGLITFLTTMHPVVAGLGISLTAVSVVIFVLTTAIPAVWPTAPYQSPQAWLSYRLSNSIRSLFSTSSRVRERPALKANHNGWDGYARYTAIFRAQLLLPLAKLLLMSSAFERAHDFTLSASEINFGITNYYSRGGGSRAAALQNLRDHISAGAMHDSAERCDAPKCHPETRVAVQDEVTSWILHGDGDGQPKKILWMTGPAGTGKTAIAGSIADTCHTKGILACGFFFSSFAGPANRRSKRCLVATLAYQLVQHGALRDVGERILSCVERNPAIFERQLEVQLDQLLLQPLRDSRSNGDTSSWPKVIVLDGLDECEAEQYDDTARSPRVAARTKEADQTEILSSLLKAANDPSFPFRIIITSRPEPNIQAFFTDIASYTTRKIFLDEKYNPDADMTLFLEYKFADIRRRYQLPASWPSDVVKQTLVRNATGQFIYVATIIRFMEGRSAPPQELLKQVLKLHVTNASNNPFTPLDGLYTHILNSSSDPLLTVRWLYLIFCCGLLDAPSGDAQSARFIRLFLESSPGEATHVLGSLNSLISIPPTDDHTSPYSLFHKSLRDFLKDRSRCGWLFVEHESAFAIYGARYLQIWKGMAVSSPDVLILLL
ncbi:hypothetical protein H1R20_g10006, partial [Candolleomyces eurysporus]